MLKNKYLISLDLDGTLLTSDKEISEFTKNYLKDLANDGSIIVLNSGRPLRALTPYSNLLGIDNLIICYNGQLIYDPKTKKNIFDKPFKKEDIRKILSKCDKDFIKCIMCEDDKNIYLSKPGYFDFLYHDYENKMKFYTGKIEDLLKDDVYTCIFEYDEKPCESSIFFDNLTNEFNDLGLRYWYSGRFCEIYHTDINKETAISEIAKIYNITKENIYAFGDADNDLDIITKVENGVAMINGSEEIKKVAKYITEEDNDHDGIAKFLMEHLV